MTKRLRSVWISHKGNPMFGLNVTGYGSDWEGIVAEINAAEKMLCRKPWNSVLMVIDLAYTDFVPEVAAFINAHQGQQGDTIRRLAIIGVPGFKRWWYRVTKKVTWPKHSRFFDEHEKAKAWLVGEIF